MPDEKTPVLIKVQHNGQELEVEKPQGIFTAEEVGASYVPRAAHNDQMARMRKELDGFKGRRTEEELLGDEEFRGRAIESWGIKTTSPKEVQDRIKAAREEVVTREVTPLKQQIEKLGATVGKLRQSDLITQILQAATAARISDDLLKPATKGGIPIIVSMLRDAYMYSEEHDGWFARGSNGQPAFSQLGDANVPYQSVQEHLAGWAGGEGKGFVKSEKQSGAGAGDTPPGQRGGISGGVMKITAEQARDPVVYRQLRAQAEKEGLTIQPV